MKLLKPWGKAGGDLLHLTVLLSLDEAPHRPGPWVWTGFAPAAARPYALSPFPAWGSWGRARQLHPKSREHDPAVPPEGHLLREVRALGAPFIRRTRVDAWLVHSVADGDADGAPGLFGAASAGGVGASVDGDSHAAPGGGGDLRLARSSPVAAGEEEKAPAEPTAQVPDAGGGASQENDLLREKGEAVDCGSQHQEDEAKASAQERPRQQKTADGNRAAAKAAWEAEAGSGSGSEIQLNGADTSLSLEDLFQLLSSQPEYSLEGTSLEDISLQDNISDGMNSPAHIDFSQALSHDVNLHEAMLLYPNSTFRRDPTSRTSQAQEPFLQFSPPTNPEQTFHGTNLTRLLPVDNQMRNLTSQDLLHDLDITMFDEINLTSLAIEEGFNPVEISQLFEEPDSDSDLSLNSSHNSTSVSKSSSSHSVCEGATGSNSDPEPLSCDLEGAVGGYYPEPSKFHHTDHGDLAFQHVLHNHTYHFQPCAPESTSVPFSWSGTSQKMSKCTDDTDRNLSRDERCAKALRIPFSVDEIVRMPVDSFNSMLSRHYLTDLQVSLIRDIRRRGKNKVAAQNCRKRKLDIILNLEDDVCNLQAKKETLESERAQCSKAINMMRQKLHDLYHDVFSRLRDDQGRPVNPNQFALQCSHDGSVLIVPKELAASGHKKENQKGKRKK
uniref:Nuclear factor erythroid 2-related factor 3 n=1 Tax=Oryctolagus cuniculus TaxID=9986 RepID=G1SJ38_RABIT